MLRLGKHNNSVPRHTWDICGLKFPTKANNPAYDRKTYQKGSKIKEPNKCFRFQNLYHCGVCFPRSSKEQKLTRVEKVPKLKELVPIGRPHREWNLGDVSIFIWEYVVFFWIQTRLKFSIVRCSWYFKYEGND